MNGPGLVRKTVPRDNMKMHFLAQKANQKQIEEMLSTLESYIKVAVDIKNRILVGGGALRADCEAVLIESGSKQDNVWGANWYPKEKKLDVR